MKIDNVQIPKSSFLSVDKDFSIIINKFLSNNRLEKLLFYTTKDCLSRPNLTEDEELGLLNREIKIVPKLQIDREVLNYVIIRFNNFVTNETNPEFRDNTIHFDIVCHYDQWLMKDFQLRPYRIAAEIDSMLDRQRLTGIGKLEFVSMSQLILNNEFGGVTMTYSAIHGEEDKKFMLNPADDEQFVKDFLERAKAEREKTENV